MVPAHAQAYPAKAVRIVVPFPAGGGVDVLIRAVAAELAAKWQHPVIVENKAGAGSVIGADFVAKSPADGYTLLATINQTLTANRNEEETTMNTPTAGRSDFDAAGSLPQLHELLERIHVKNGWSKPTPSLYPRPKQRFVPAHWQFADGRAALHAAGRLVGTEWAERRNLILANPILGNDYPTVTTLVAAYQMVKAGEKARSHRHSPNAMRVVVEAAPQTYTVVDGVDVPMEPGDVLLTPNWSFHGHDNRSAADAYWIDILDAPLVQLLGPMFFEHHPADFERAETLDPRSPMRFAFSDYQPQVLASEPVEPGVRQLVLGPPTLDTFDRVVVALEAGARWDAARTTANQIFIVVQGHGESRIGEQRFAWSRGDVMAAPSWIDQEHTAGSDAILIRMSDAPVMAAFRWLRSRGKEQQ